MCIRDRAITLIYSVCCVLRLARFNLTKFKPEEIWKQNYFEGVPSPIGALLILSPLVLELTEFNFLINNNYYFDRSKVLKYLPGYMLKEAFNKISRWKGYAKTPLISLNKLSNELKLGEIFYNDESKRLHLKFCFN